MNEGDNGDVDLNSVFPNDSKVLINESDRLDLAKKLLMWIGIICIGVFIAYSMYPDNKALSSIFELIKIGALPLITLVVSFYFPNSNN